MKIQHPTVTKVHYLTDGCGAHYKNKYNFSNLCYHYDDFHLEAEWNFFATFRGKRTCDSIGGTVKRLVSKASLKRPQHSQILIPIDMFKYCEVNITGIHFLYVQSITVKENQEKLQERYDAAHTVKGTRQLHRFVPQPHGKLLVYHTSLQTSSPTEFTYVKYMDPNSTLPEEQTFQIGSFVACVYDKKWWIRMVAQV